MVRRTSFHRNLSDCARVCTFFYYASAEKYCVPLPDNGSRTFCTIQRVAHHGKMFSNEFTSPRILIDASDRAKSVVICTAQDASPGNANGPHDQPVIY